MSVSAVVLPEQIGAPWAQAEAAQVDRHPRGAFTIGRSASCNVVADSKLVSQIHARIERSGPALTITDPQSSNGTAVNGSKVQTLVLQDGDVIEVAGSRHYRVVLETGEVETGDVPRQDFEGSLSLPMDWQTRIEWAPGEKESVAKAAGTGRKVPKVPSLLAPRPAAAPGSDRNAPPAAPLRLPGGSEAAAPHPVHKTSAPAPHAPAPLPIPNMRSPSGPPGASEPPVAEKAPAAAPVEKAPPAAAVVKAPAATLTEKAPASAAVEKAPLGVPMEVAPGNLPEETSAPSGFPAAVPPPASASLAIPAPPRAEEQRTSPVEPPTSPPSPPIAPAAPAPPPDAREALEATRIVRKTTAFHVLLEGASGSFILGRGDHAVGRLPGSAVFIQTLDVSRRHAQIRIGDATATVEDLQSGNVTFRNGRRLASAEQVADGDELSFGDLKFRVRFARPADPPGNR